MHWGGVKHVWISLPSMALCTFLTDTRSHTAIFRRIYPHKKFLNTFWSNIDACLTCRNFHFFIWLTSDPQLAFYKQIRSLTGIHRRSDICIYQKLFVASRNWFVSWILINRFFSIFILMVFKNIVDILRISIVVSIALLIIFLTIGLDSLIYSSLGISVTKVVDYFFLYPIIWLDVYTIEF